MQISGKRKGSGVSCRTRSAVLLLVTLASIDLANCAGSPSTRDPRDPCAAQTNPLTWLLFAIATVLNDPRFQRATLARRFTAVLVVIRRQLLRSLIHGKYIQYACA